MRFVPGLPTPSGTLSDYVIRQAHAFSREDLLGSWPRSQLDRGLTDGAVTRLLPDVYCAKRHARDAVVMGEALNLWAPGGLITGALALALYAPGLATPHTADLAVQYGRHMRAPSWVRVAQRAPQTVSSRARGVSCVVPERALLDAWCRATPRTRSDVLYGAMWERVCTWKQLAREAERAPRVVARRDLERLLGWFAVGATSPLEVRARREVFTGARFRDFEWQVELDVLGRRPLADMLHQAAKVVVELDGQRYHSGKDARQSDTNRDVDLAASGYLTVRFTWHDIAERPGWCRERLTAVVGSRLARSVST